MTLLKKAIIMLTTTNGMPRTFPSLTATVFLQAPMKTDFLLKTALHFLRRLLLHQEPMPYILTKLLICTRTGYGMHRILSMPRKTG